MGFQTRALGSEKTAPDKNRSAKNDIVQSGKDTPRQAKFQPLSQLDNWRFQLSLSTAERSHDTSTSWFQLKLMLKRYFY